MGMVPNWTIPTPPPHRRLRSRAGESVVSGWEWDVRPEVAGEFVDVDHGNALFPAGVGGVHNHPARRGGSCAFIRVVRGVRDHLIRNLERDEYLPATVETRARRILGRLCRNW